MLLFISEFQYWAGETGKKNDYFLIASFIAFASVFWLKGFWTKHFAPLLITLLIPVKPSLL